MTNFTSFFKGKTPAALIQLAIAIVAISNFPAPMVFAIVALFVLLFAAKRGKAYAAENK